MYFYALLKSILKSWIFYELYLLKKKKKVITCMCCFFVLQCTNVYTNVWILKCKVVFKRLTGANATCFKCTDLLQTFKPVLFLNLEFLKHLLSTSYTYRIFINIVYIYMSLTWAIWGKCWLMLSLFDSGMHHCRQLDDQAQKKCCSGQAWSQRSHAHPANGLHTLRWGEP